MKGDFPRFKSHYLHEELVQHFSLAQPELRFLGGFRGGSNRQTAALMLKALTHVGYFPRTPKQIPLQVRSFMAQQLGDAEDQSGDGMARRSRVRQWAKIRAFAGWTAARAQDKRDLQTWLFQEGAISAPSADKLFDLACHHLRQRRIELPTEAELRRLVAAALNHYFQDLYRNLTAALSVEVKAALDALVRIPRGQTMSTFERLKIGPGKPGIKGLEIEMAKLKQLRSLNVPREIFTTIPWRVLALLKRRATNERASRLRTHPMVVRHALLACFVHVHAAEVTDDVLKMLVETVQKLDRGSEHQFTQALLHDLGRLERRLDLLGHIAEAAIANPDGTVRNVIFPLADEAALNKLAAERRARGPRGRRLRQELMHRKFVRHYRRLLPPILETLEFQSDTRFQPVMEALRVIRETARTRGRHFSTPVPVLGIVPRNWQDQVFEEVNGQHKVNRRYYELCVLHQLQRGLKCKEVWVDGSLVYRNPREDMPTDWENAVRRTAHYEKLGKPTEPRSFIDEVRRRLTRALEAFNRDLPHLAHLRLAHPDTAAPERGVFALEKLPRQDEPTSLRLIKDEISRQYGMLELLDVFAEADRRTDFTRFFGHSGPKEVRSRDRLRPLLLLALFAEGTNLGAKRVINASRRFAYEELLYVRKHYLSADAIRNANIAVVNKILEIRNPRLWGEGRACASDGKRFESWSQNLMTEWRTRYRGDGVLVYWHVDTNAVCIYSQLKSFSSSEVASMMEGLIRHDTEMRVEKNFVDSHGQSEITFAFCHLLGTVRLMPRLKRIKYERLYLPGKGSADQFSNLTDVLARPIRWELIEAQYDDMIRATVALKDGTATTEAILKRFNSFNRAHPTYRALAELGKAEKTIYLCEYLASRPIQYEVNDGLQVVENWNATNEFICYGQRGELTTNSREEQEVTVVSLQLLQNCLMLINTILVERTIDRQDLQLGPEDLRGLTTLFYNHINPYGTFVLDLNRRSFLEAA